MLLLTPGYFILLFLAAPLVKKNLTTGHLNRVQGTRVIYIAFGGNFSRFFSKSSTLRYDHLFSLFGCFQYVQNIPDSLLAETCKPFIIILLVFTISVAQSSDLITHLLEDTYYLSTL